MITFTVPEDNTIDIFGFDVDSNRLNPITSLLTVDYNDTDIELSNLPKLNAYILKLTDGLRFNTEYILNTIENDSDTQFSIERTEDLIANYHYSNSRRLYSGDTWDFIYQTSTGFPGIYNNDNGYDTMGTKPLAAINDKNIIFFTTFTNSSGSISGNHSPNQDETMYKLLRQPCIDSIFWNNFDSLKESTENIFFEILDTSASRRFSSTADIIVYPNQTIDSIWANSAINEIFS